MGNTDMQRNKTACTETAQTTEIEAVSALLIYAEELLKEHGGTRAARAVFDADMVLREEFSLPARFDEAKAVLFHGHS